MKKLCLSPIPGAVQQYGQCRESLEHEKSKGSDRHLLPDIDEAVKMLPLLVLDSSVEFKVGQGRERRMIFLA